MAVAVVMPRQGQSVETCIITRWHKSRGEQVNAGDILFSYETDKAAFDEEAPESGVLLDIFFNDGDEVPVLDTVAVIGKEGEDYGALIPAATGSSRSAGKDPGAGTGRAVEKAGEAEPGGKAGQGEAVESTRDAGRAGGVQSTAEAGQSGGDKIRISPLARKLASGMKISLSGIKGTGPGGRIIERDIRNAAQGKGYTGQTGYLAGEQAVRSEPAAAYGKSSPTSYGHEQESGEGFTFFKLSNMRKIIAGRMEESLRNSAQLTHHMSADARKILAWRKDVKSVAGREGVVDISINDMVSFAVVRALKKHSYMNAHFTGDGIKVFNKVHLGIAVDTERGLMVPVVRDADDMNVGGLAKRLKEVAGECRKGDVDPGLLASEAAGFTVTNLGAFGVEMFTPVLNLPQIGILGVNTITWRPSDMGDGVIGFIPVIGLSLTYDHRAVDGSPASVFLAGVKKEIENIDHYRDFKV